MSARRHLFISHHHKDDGAVDRFLSLLGRKGWDVRNSSIRAKPANETRLKQGLVSDDKIRRILRMKISWSTTVVVLVGKGTHQRPWVDWEIEQAHRQGKRIVGVYERGGQEADLPTGLSKYASAIVAWSADSIKAAIDGEDNRFEDSDGKERSPRSDASRSIC
ncbi:MAG: TIR domain-containing protein [Myxococcota bacterium]